MKFVSFYGSFSNHVASDIRIVISDSYSLDSMCSSSYSKRRCSSFFFPEKSEALLPSLHCNNWCANCWVNLLLVFQNQRKDWSCHHVNGLSPTKLNLRIDYVNLSLASLGILSSFPQLCLFVLSPLSSSAHTFYSYVSGRFYVLSPLPGLTANSLVSEHCDIIFICLFIFKLRLHWVLLAAHGLSLVGVCWFSCPVACGILVPPPEIKPVSPALESRFLTTGPPREVSTVAFLNIINIPWALVFVDHTYYYLFQ